MRSIASSLLTSILSALLFGGCSSDSQSPAPEARIFHFTKTDRPFRGGDHFIDPSTLIVLTKQRGPRSNGYHVDLRGLEPDHDESGFAWRSEFFCEPDSILIGYNDHIYEKSYLNYLNWIDDAHQTPKRAWISLKHFAGNGSLRGLIPESALQTHSSPRFDITEDHRLRLGNPFVETSVALTNRHDETLSAIYIYQDAAFLWFPRGDQKTIVPLNVELRLDTPYPGVSASSEYRSMILPHDAMAFSGFFDPEHSVLSGLVAVDPGLMIGTIRGYLSIDGGTREESGSFHFLTPDEVTFETLTSSVGMTRVKNRYVAAELEDIAPGESVKLRFYRFMSYRPGVRVTPEEWLQLLEAELISFHDQLRREEERTRRQRGNGRSLPAGAVNPTNDGG
jgi:hypothetical protein